MPKKAAYGSQEHLASRIKAARGEIRASLVVKNVAFLDVFSGTFRKGDVAVFEGTIVGVADAYEGLDEVDGAGMYLVPGFIDAHVHIESSLMTPERFSETVLPTGTTAVVWDPHEIANVKGQAGIDWALSASEGIPLDVFVMVPSCVPSTSPSFGFETSGADLRAGDLRKYRDHPRVLGLAEMMNFPGLLNGDDDVLQKLSDFDQMKRDGHCPGLTGKDLNAYGVAGIHSCHESTSLAEAQEKQMKGIHVLIREGSCAKDADALVPLLNEFSSACTALCSDDRNPADIAEEGHINHIVAMALAKGISAEAAFRAASYAPARMYGLDDRGAIAPGYLADFVLVKKKNEGAWANGFDVVDVYKSGVSVSKLKTPNAASSRPFPGKNLNLAPVNAADFAVSVKGKVETAVQVIGVIPRQILTQHLDAVVLIGDHGASIDLAQDVLKIAVLERHQGTGRKTVGFVKGFGIKNGAIATSINHDSHNVIVVGASEALMAQAVNELIKIDGGIVVVSDSGEVGSLPLPIGGLMTDAAPSEVAKRLRSLKALAEKIGCVLEEPFLQLSFLALPVIPALKITDRGLVDVSLFKMISVVPEA